MDFRHKGSVKRKLFPCHDVIKSLICNNCHLSGYIIKVYSYTSFSYLSCSWSRAWFANLAVRRLFSLWHSNCMWRAFYVIRSNIYMITKRCWYLSFASLNIKNYSHCCFQMALVEWQINLIAHFPWTSRLGEQMGSYFHKIAGCAGFIVVLSVSLHEVPPILVPEPRQVYLWGVGSGRFEGWFYCRIFCCEAGYSIKGPQQKRPTERQRALLSP